ncbi:guanine nucleotide binding protein, alpha subunit [Suillus variegatus]|nr:guanine nucleotide binding protein, alpha subunit [Suillus variegatus]
MVSAESENSADTLTYLTEAYGNRIAEFNKNHFMPLGTIILPDLYTSHGRQWNHRQKREQRLAAEQEAKRVSDAIDDELNKQRISEKKGPKAIKILLLGKSTTLKNFQLMNSPKAFRSERASWRAVIQLNVEYPPLNPEHLKLKMRLAPLLQVEVALIKKLIPNGHAQLSNLANPAQSLPIQQEISVNSSVGWKNTFSRLMGRNSCDSADLIDWSDPDDPGVVLNACAEDMKRLWTDPIIRKLMDIEKMRPEEMAGFFLDALDRVTSPRYVPTDDDVLRARLKTLGVSEHRFTMKTGSMGSPMSHDWRVFDVGGQRSLRAAWVPYFDDMNAIIFLAPISCFDQVLQEDPSVNRLADSFLLWKAIVSNPLLKKTELILFLNKCDILRAKLSSGIRLADYIVSYGSRPNDFESANLKKKFAGLLKEHSPERLYYFHLTSVTDTKSTTYILENVQDVLVRDNLRRSALVT